MSTTKKLKHKPLVLIKGAGDLATGVAYRLRQAHFSVMMTELEQPFAVRRSVSFAEAVYAGETAVEGVLARHTTTLAEATSLLQTGTIPVLAPATLDDLRALKPDIFIDATMAKTNTGTTIHDAKLVIALGPGFEAGQDCHVVIETQRGHRLGRVIREGGALPDTGTPGAIDGYTATRVLRAPVDGFVTSRHPIGTRVAAGDIIATMSEMPDSPNGVPIRAAFPGILRGIVHPQRHVEAGRKIGDLDPRNEIGHCFTISEKSLSVAGGVLEAILHEQFLP